MKNVYIYLLVIVITPCFVYAMKENDEHNAVIKRLSEIHREYGGTWEEKDNEYSIELLDEIDGKISIQKVVHQQDTNETFECFIKNKLGSAVLCHCTTKLEQKYDTYKKLKFKFKVGYQNTYTDTISYFRLSTTIMRKGNNPLFVSWSIPVKKSENLLQYVQNVYQSFKNLEGNIEVIKTIIEQLAAKNE